MKRRLIIGISGASGAIYGIRALEALKDNPDVETHLVMSPSAGRTIAEETDWSVKDVKALATQVYNYADIGDTIASGSFKTAGMLVAPCSIKSLSSIANCFGDNLLTRAADVCLKERRRLVLMVRETPFHAGHIDIMSRATNSGAIIMPPVPAFYSRPASIDEMVNHTVGRALDLFDIDTGLVKRWMGESKSA
ncbi:UbiX family flavin prenyltransferase [Paraburkholderia sp. CNPSo 3155]|uniref:UbiX family flavin prenyltransferase n=1 Tax=Paraburkholderia atlantica TaxID=2654982 RepID=UPI0013228552|nr:UbiX family flavin prenyltransferase [Paraburkholderia atlantica]MPW10960.1 UbiX family flavin prenyltransferase [Paraburkholderia atlantica]